MGIAGEKMGPGPKKRTKIGFWGSYAFFLGRDPQLFQGVTGECSMNGKEYHIQGIASEVARGE